MNLRELVRYRRTAIKTWRLVAQEYGWRQSFIEGRAVASQGRPIPWYTYPAIEFLRSLDLHGCRVFEFGCGNSSIFWAERVREVFSVEHDIDWARAVRAYGIPNLILFDEVDIDRYVTAPERAGGAFNIVVIDGRHRRACVPASVRVVADTGMIILDNADWYPEACADLRSLGWFQIDFSGLGPINPYCWTTSIFMKCSADFARSSSVQPIGGISQ